MHWQPWSSETITGDILRSLRQVSGTRIPGGPRVEQDTGTAAAQPTPIWSLQSFSKDSTFELYFPTWGLQS